MPTCLDNSKNLSQINSLIYISAVAIIRTLGLRTIAPQENLSRVAVNLPTTRAWEKRLQKKVEHLRKEMGQLTEFAKGTPSIKLTRSVNKIIKPLSHNELTVNQLTEIKDKKRQQLAASSKRLARYKKNRTRKQQNKSFKGDQRKFFRKLKENPNEQSPTIPIELASTYWSSIWSEPRNFRENSIWLEEEEMEASNVEPMSQDVVTTQEIQEAILQTENWKAPGPDKIHNFWIKNLSVLHAHIARCFSDIFLQPEIIPNYLAGGNTYLLPKGGDGGDPAQYRPITCLNTVYKLLTKIIANRVYNHCSRNNIITQEQKGCSRNSKGCKDQLIIDTVIVQQAVQKKRNLSMCFIDYKKAFDSLPHTYLIEILRLYGISNNIITTLKHLMSIWNVKLHLGGQSSHPINIKNGILQGDAFSPLWFCLALNPLSKLIKRSKIGYELKGVSQSTSVNHLLFVDDLKLYASNKDKMHRLISIVKDFSDDISMEFGLEKCKIINLVRGKVQTTAEGYPINENQVISELADGDSYKYLGMLQLKGLCLGKIKEHLKKEFSNRIKLILKTDLNAGNKTRAINTWAVPVLTYSFGLLKWSNTDLDQIAMSVRTLLSRAQSHHPKSAIERMTIPRSQGGRGMVDIIALHHQQKINLRNYFMSLSSEELIKVVIEADSSFTPLNLSASNLPMPDNLKTATEQLDLWKSKALHGIHPKDLAESHVDAELSNRWLKKGELYAETEGFVIAIQDKVVPTRNYRKFVMREDIASDSCRRCGSVRETIDHIIAGCTTLSSYDYTNRHNNVGKILHQDLALRYKLISKYTPYYKYEPPPVLENLNAVLYWDRTIITDRTILANRPDIVLFDKMENNIDIYDVAIPLNHNIQTTISTKINKYTELANELQKMYVARNVKINPIVISATGLIPKSLTQTLKKINMEHNLESMQKAVLLATCNIVRRFLQ